MGNASIWNPGGTTVPTVNANLTLKSEKFTAAAGQTILDLVTFQYQPGTGSLLVEINGVDQFLGDDYTETSYTRVTLVSPLELGDKVVVRGYIGGAAAQTAATSAAIAVAAATSAVGAPSTFATSTTNLTPAVVPQTLTIQTGKLFLAGMGVLVSNSANCWMFGNVTSYDSVTGILVVNVLSIGTDTTAKAVWSVSLSATQLTLPVPVTAGGTGATSKQAGFDALVPAVTKGSITVGNGAHAISLAAGADGLALVADSTTAEGVAWKAVGGINATSKTASYVAVAGDNYPQDTSAGTFAITMPAAPVVGDRPVLIHDIAGTFNTNNLTFVLGGNKFMGQTSFTMDIKNFSGLAVWSGATYGWRFL